MAAAEFVALERTGDGVAVLRFTGPAPHRLSDACLDAVDDALAALEGDPPAALLLCGAPGNFLAGADLKELLECMGPNAPLRGLAKASRGRRTLRALAEFPAFTAAFIDGHCLGGGLDLALHCDARWVSPRASLGHPGIARHFFTGWGGTELLARHPGGAGWLLNGTVLDAPAAINAGLAGAVADESAARALAAQAAARVAMIPPAARKLLKQSAWRTAGRRGRAASKLLCKAKELAALAER